MKNDMRRDAAISTGYISTRTDFGYEKAGFPDSKRLWLLGPGLAT